AGTRPDPAAHERLRGSAILLTPGPEAPPGAASPALPVVSRGGIRSSPSPARPPRSRPGSGRTPPAASSPAERSRRRLPRHLSHPPPGAATVTTPQPDGHEAEETRADDVH